MKKNIFIPVILISMFSIISCDEDNMEDTVSPEQVEISFKTGATTYNSGDKIDFEVIADDNDGIHYYYLDIAYKSNPDSIIYTTKVHEHGTVATLYWVADTDKHADFIAIARVSDHNDNESSSMPIEFHVHPKEHNHGDGNEHDEEGDKEHDHHHGEGGHHHGDM